MGGARGNQTETTAHDRPNRPPPRRPSLRGVDMMTRSFALLAATAFVAAGAAMPAMAGSCCGCAYTCAPPAQVQIWGLSPEYVVNQGPVFSGPGFYTAPTYEGEASTVDYPYIRYGAYPRYDGGPDADPFRHRLYHKYRETHQAAVRRLLAR